MKYVTFLFALALLGVAGIASATEQKSVSFDYSNHNSYYACSYAEGQMAKTLVAIGASEISTNCTGGIQGNQFWPVSMDATFTHGDKGVRTVVLKGRESCDFNVKLINAVLATVEHTVVKAQSSCWDSSGRYHFEIALK